MPPPYPPPVLNIFITSLSLNPRSAAPLMVKDLRLELQNPSGQAVYCFPGEVTGTVVVVTDEPTSYNAITVTLKGYTPLKLAALSPAAHS